ncbi:hypothetical protein NM688_g3328 [Phlebia brevispora]|uniref:Uncharacterized protein n=1 Tax=Phlebia brevispora TaxID=194682 RepID=A0ACC1T636_9APHY|nr:hypothetical protein NM688_g3328 [Phlebia brevispora]
MQPSTCPLCRKAFLPDRVKKLHIDRPPSAIGGDDDSTRVNELLHRIALVSGENVVEEQVMGVISEVQQWLATRDDRSHAVYKPLRLAVTALHRSTAARKEYVSIRETVEKQNKEYLKHLHLKEEDLRMSRTIEENLLERIQRLEDKYKTEVISFCMPSQLQLTARLSSAQLTRAQKNMAETDAELARLRAEHARFRAELARHQDRDNLQPRALPRNNAVFRPHSPEPGTARIDRGRLVPSLDAGWYHNAYYTGRTVRPPERPLEAFDEIIGRGLTSPELESLAQRRAAGTPWIIPGAPDHRKVIPPPPADPLPMGNNIGYVNPVPIADGVVTDRRSERSERTPRGEAGPTFVRTPDYGFVIGTGYVPLREPSLAATSQVEERSAVGQLMLYSETGQAPFSADDRPRTVEAAARALAVSSGEVETAESTWGHVQNALRHSIPWNESTSSLATTAATTDRPDGVSDTSATTSASASSTNLAVLAGPHARDSHRHASTLNSAPQGTENSNPPSPSLVSTWGTVPSARSSRSSGLGDLDLAGFPSTMDLTTAVSSHNPSLADLNLVNLPSARSYESLGANSTAPDHVGTLDHRTSTPRAMPWDSTLSNGADSTRSQVAPARDNAPNISNLPGGLGLMFSGSSGSLVSGQQDLDQVNESLRQLLSEERNRVSLRRHSRYSSMSVVENHLRSPFPPPRSQEQSRISDNVSVTSIEPTTSTVPMHRISAQSDSGSQAHALQGVPLATSATAPADRAASYQRAIPL